MKFDKSDLNQLDNLLKALKEGKFDLKGVEVLLVASALNWTVQLYNKMKAEVEAPAFSIKPEVPPPLQEAPAEVAPASMAIPKKRGK